MAHDNFYSLINPVKVKELVRSWINEDIPSFDFQGMVVGYGMVNANIYCKQPGVLAGVPFVDTICSELDLEKPKWLFNEGYYFKDASLDNKITVATVCGSAKQILIAERIILNVLTRCSGVATKAFKIREKLNELKWNGELVGTRKTTPGFRYVEKYGLKVGGVGTHRYDLSSMIMLKDNHVTISGNNMNEIIPKLKRQAGFQLKIEVECSSYEDGQRAAEAGADIIMLDNMSAFDGSIASKQLKSQYPNILIEASGGITEENVHEYAIESYDIISMSCLTQGYSCVDFSMKVQ